MELKFCDILPPQFRLPNEDPNLVLQPVLDAFCEIEEETIKPAIRELSLISSIEFSRAIDLVLKNLGNPFAFAVLTDSQQRRLARSLIQIYRKKGTKSGIELAILFFTTLTADVKDFTEPGEVWTLGISKLGVETFLGPGPESADLFFFIVEFDDCLPTLTRQQVTQIIEFMKPGWTHYIIRDCLNPSLPLIEEFEDASWLS